MKRRRALLITLVVAPALLVILALLYLNFADLGRWRDGVAGLASDAIGRELRIEGEFEPEIGFATRVVATDISLANADWSEYPQMVSVERLAGEIDLLSILLGPITIRDVEISGARVLFEVDREGRFNWALGDGEPSDGGGGEVELVIGHALLTDAELVYASSQDRALEAALERLELTDDGTGMLELDVQGQVEGTPLDISGRLGTFIGLMNASRVEHDLSGRFGNADFALQGTIDDLSSLSGVDAEASVEGPGLSRVTAVLGFAEITDHPFEAEVSVRPATAGSAFDLDAAVGEMTAELTGTIDSLGDPGILEVAIDLSGPTLATIGSIAGVKDLPDQPFAASGRIRWAGFPLTCENVEARVGDNTLSVHGVIGEPPLMMGTDFRFSGGGPDISAVAALAGLEVPTERYAIGGHLVRLEHGIDVEKIRLEVGALTVEADGTVGDPPGYQGTALSFHGEGSNLAQLESLVGITLPAESFSINGELERGGNAIELEGVRAQVGESSFQVSGELSTVASLTGTDLRLQARGPDASKLAALANLGAVPAEPFSVEGRVRFLANGYRIHDVVGSLGSLNLEADGLIVPSPSLVGSDLQIHIDDSDLTHSASIARIADLSPDPMRVDARVQVEESGYRVTGFEARIGEISTKVDGFVGLPPEFDGTELSFTARGPRLDSLDPYLDHIGLPRAPFSASGKVRIAKGSYALDGVVAEVDGHRVAFDGIVWPVKGLVGTDLEIGVSFPDFGRAVRLASALAELPELPEEPLTLTARLAVDPSGYVVDDLRASLGAAEVVVDGRIGAFPGLIGTDLSIDGHGPDASLFKAVTGATMPVAPFQLSGRVQRNEAGLRFHRVSARLGEYRAAIDGTLGELPKLIGTDIEIRTLGPGTDLIQELIGVSGFPDRPFQLDGTFSGTPERFASRDFRFTFGPSDLEGSFTVDITGKPDIRARLASNTVDLSRLRDHLSTEDLPPEERDERPPPAKKRRVLSDKPLDLAWLHTADADVELRIENLLLRATQLHDVAADVRLEDGHLDIERLAGTGRSKGTVDGSLVLEPADRGFRARSRLSGRRLRLDVEGFEIDRLAQPPIDIDIDLEVLGATPHELASSANGAMQLVIGKGTMDSRALDLVTADILLTLLKALNPFSKEDPTTELQCGVALLTLEDGLATLQPMAFQSDKMTLLGNGKIDLRTEKLNLHWITKPRKGIGISASMITNPYIKLGGTLANPVIELKPLEAVTSTGVAVATMGISLVAKGMFDRITAERKVCKKALEKIGARERDSLQGSPD